jgi:YfiH family protein
MNPLRHQLLDATGVTHGFGVRGFAPPPGLRRPKQVHGARVARAEDCAADAAPDADVVLSSLPGVPIGVVTADCVPILVATQTGETVAAIHAGWRGLAGGVVEAGIAALRAGTPGSPRLVAAIGPHIGPCCYEVDEPVLAALAPGFGKELAAALRPGRPGHAWLDLGQLTRASLLRSGVESDAVGALPGACTRCHPERFHSYRREGVSAGRLYHFIAARGALA